MGRVYFVINPIVTNYKSSLLKQEPIKKEKLSDLIVQLKKKGIELDVKRSQTGDNPNTIYGLLFKDIKESHTYTASDLKIKTKDFLNMIDDDMKNLSTEDKINLVSDDKEVKSKNPFIKNEEDINDKNINALDELLKIFSGHSQNNEESKAPVKKRKRKRRS